MEKIFNQLSATLFPELKNHEALVLSFSGERSQFIRLNNAAIRQTGLVDNADLGLKFISNNRTVQGGFTVSGDLETDLQRGRSELSRMRQEVHEIPEDPYQVIPENSGSSREINVARGLPFEHAVDALLPVIQGVDFVGIWANGKIYRGNANNLGQKHWFETETFSLDFSLVTTTHQMVKGTYAGTDWDQIEYENYVKKSKEKLQLMNRKPVSVKTGKYRTWFESAAVADFIGMFSWNGLSEASIQQGCSGFGKMRHGDFRLSPNFSLREDFTPGLCPRFNTDGEVSEDTLSLIENGVLRNTLVSSRSAKEYNVKTNYAESGEILRSPMITAGSLKQNEISQAIGTGLLLSNIHYLNWSDNAGGRITGLTRYACFWVENGEIVAPLNSMRFDDSFYNFLGNNLEALEDKVSVNPDVLTYGGRSLGAITCPGILVNDFELTL